MGLVLAGAVVLALAACGGTSHQASPPASASASPSAAESLSPSPSPSALPSPSAKPSPKPSKKPSPSPTKRKVSTNTVPPVAEKPPVKPAAGDGVPTHGAGTFAIAAGSTDIVGAGTTLVKYQVEIEQGIVWGDNHPWTVDEFASTVDGILAGSRGWTMSAEHPVTDPDEQMTDASWAFQRVSGTYSVRIRLATPDTVDKLCGSAGVSTEGVYSCRYGKNIMINLRRWLKGATGFTDMPFYRNMVINHEMGHFLGFNHMKCPGAGQVAPVMQTQTIALNGCTPNALPFTAEGEFVLGPWAPS